jgi:hypothetical protein
MNLGEGMLAWISADQLSSSILITAPLPWALPALAPEACHSGCTGCVQMEHLC